MGFAIKASGLYDNGNDEWLGMGQDAWPVAYHGIKNIAHVLPRVLKGNYEGGGLRPGHRNEYNSQKPAIYCSPNFNFALIYANKEYLSNETI